MNTIFYTTSELADKWKVTEKTIRNLCNNNELDFVKIGTQYRISEESIEKYLNKDKKEEE